MKNKLIVILLLISPCFSAQEIDPDDSFTFEISLPNSISNTPYKMIMQGLIQTSAT